MRFSTALVLFSAGLVSAQTSTASPSLGNLPACASSCVGTSLTTTGCSNFDIACICKSSNWIAGLACCVAQTCSPADQQATIQYAQSICSTAGVTNLPTSASCTSGATASSTVPPTGSTSGTSKTTTTSTKAGSGSSSSVSAASTSSKGVGVSQQEFSPAGFFAMAGAGLMMAL